MIGPQQQQVGLGRKGNVRAAAVDLPAAGLARPSLERRQFAVGHRQVTGHVDRGQLFTGRQGWHKLGQSFFVGQLQQQARCEAGRGPQWTARQLPAEFFERNPHFEIAETCAAQSLGHQQARKAQLGARLLPGLAVVDFAVVCTRERAHAFERPALLGKTSHDFAEMLLFFAETEVHPAVFQALMIRPVDPRRACQPTGLLRAAGPAPARLLCCAALRRCRRQCAGQGQNKNGAGLRPRP